MSYLRCSHRGLAAQLEDVDPSQLAHHQRLAFWINIHNCLLLHVRAGAKKKKKVLTKKQCTVPLLPKAPLQCSASVPWSSGEMLQYSAVLYSFANSTVGPWGCPRSIPSFSRVGFLARVFDCLHFAECVTLLLQAYLTKPPPTTDSARIALFTEVSVPTRGLFTRPLHSWAVRWSPTRSSGDWNGFVFENR